MKLTLLGTCSGTEPLPGRLHVAFTIEQQGKLYWFDAGETCSRTARLAGVDLLSVQAVFISHPHMDHIGGLANLLWTMKKLIGIKEDTRQRLTGRTVPIFVPVSSVWEGVSLLVGASPDDSSFPFKPDGRVYSEGVIFEDDLVSVSALRNSHMRTPPGVPSQSYSFRIESGGKTVVYSGDVGDVSELAPILESADLLLMETGHHKVEAVCGWLKEHAPDLGRLGFIHHGRAILADADGELKKANAILGDRVFIADDGMVVEL